MGGALTAIERGYIQREIHESAYEHQKCVDSGTRIVVGVNKFTVEEEQEFDYLKADPQCEVEQLQRLDEIRRARDSMAVNKALDSLRAAAQGTENLMPHILRAVKDYATLGEICGVLREVFEEYKSSDIL